jgi:hypothetical protein
MEAISKLFHSYWLAYTINDELKHVHPLMVLCRDSENSFLLECVSIMYESCSLNAEIVTRNNVDYITAEQLLKMEFTNSKVLVTYYVRIYNLFYSSV